MLEKSGIISCAFWCGILGATGLLVAGFERPVWAEPGKTYVGIEACKDCHEAEYKNFKTYAKKSRSYETVKAMRKGLTDAEFYKCFECHTTGFGRSGGFRSEQETPHLKDAGCEVCHGPGSVHVKSGDPKDIRGSLKAEDCETCHNPERVAAFNYKPLVYGGAH